MNVKQLLTNDAFDQAISIISKKDKIAGTTPNSLESLKNFYEKYFKKNDNYVSFGYFNKKELISFIMLAFVENKSRGKFWIIPGIYSNLQRNIFSFNNEEIGLLIKKSFEHAEKNGYYTYYYSIAEHLSDVYEKQINKCKYIPLYRYDRFTLDVVKKNTIPQENLYYKLLGEEKKPHNMIIKKRVLKEEYQKQ